MQLTNPCARSLASPHLETNPGHLIVLEDGVCQVNDRILSLLVKTSAVFKRLNEQNKPFQFHNLSTRVFKDIVDVFLTQKYDLEKVLSLLEGFSTLECRGLSEDLQIKLAIKIKAFELSDRNFSQCINGYLWASKWNLATVKASCREFIQRYIENNFDCPDISEITKAIDHLNAQRGIALALNLKNFSFSSEFFDRLKTFSVSLVSLNLISLSARLSNEDLRHLRCLANLRVLFLSCRISSALDLSSLSELHTLGFPNSDICDDDLQSLHSTSLRILNLNRCQRITGIGLKSITPKLAALTISGIKPPFFKTMTSEGYKGIGIFKKLTVLNLKRTTITSEDLPYLYSLTCLTRLDLSHSIQLDDCAIEKFQNFISLVHIFLNKCVEIKGWGLRDLPKDLQTLSLAATQIEGEFLQHLTSSRRLSSLNLNDCTSIRPLAYGALAGITSLTALSLSRSSITNEGVKNLRILPRLTYLDLQGCQQVSTKTLTTIKALLLKNSQPPFPRSQFMEASTGVSDSYSGHDIGDDFYKIPLGVQPPKDEKYKKIKRKFREEREELKRIFAEQEKRYAEQQNQLSNLVLAQKAQVEDQKGQIQDQKEQIEDLIKENATLHENCEKIQVLFDRQVVSFNKEKENFVKEKAELEQKLLKTNHTYLQQVEELKLNMTQILQESQKKFEGQIELLQAEKAFLENQMANQDLKNKEYEKQIQKLSKNIESIQKEKEQLRSRFEEQEKLFQSQIGALQTQNSNNEGQIQELSDELERHKILVESLEEEKKLLEGRIDALEKERLEVDNLLESLENDIDELQKQNKEQKELIVKKDKEIEKKDTEIGKKDEEIGKKVEEIGKKDIEIGKKDTEIGKKDKQIETKDKQIEMKDKKIEALEKKISALQNTNNYLDGIRSIYMAKKNCTTEFLNILTFGRHKHDKQQKALKQLTLMYK